MITSRRACPLRMLVALVVRLGAGAVRQVRPACTGVKTSLSKGEVAAALLAAWEEACAATLESYRSAGLARGLDLLAAQRDLARARFTEIQSRADLSLSAAPVSAAGE